MSFTSTPLFHQVLGSFHSRKLLLYSPFNHQPEGTAPPPYNGDNGIDGDVIMVLSVLLCGLVCSLGLNFLIRCILRCSRSVSSVSSGSSPATLADIGLKQKDLKTFPVVEYSTEMKLPGLDTDCVICLSEFAPADHLRLLPKCNHGFHVVCIDKWLSSHSSCPKCRHCLIDTPKNIVKGSQFRSSEPSLPVQEAIVSVAPLEPEGLIRDYRVNS